jgi:hypothetical protein
MAIRKKATAESESARTEENAKTGQSSSRVRNTAGNEATLMSDKTARPQSPAAATHKASARKSVKAAPAAEVPVESKGVKRTAFDVARHQDEIRKEAYINWLHNGCPHGSEHNDWITGIEIVRARYEK